MKNCSYWISIDLALILATYMRLLLERPEQYSNLTGGVRCKLNVNADTGFAAIFFFGPVFEFEFQSAIFDAFPIVLEREVRHGSEPPLDMYKWECVLRRKE
jgi:hypothetical protein